MRQVVVDDAYAKPFRGLDLSGAYLGGLDLKCDLPLPGGRPSPTTQPGCAEFVDANLGEALLSGSDLTGANLTDAILPRAILGGTSLVDVFGLRPDLRGADLRLADLSGAFLRYADLSGADLRGADLPGADIEAANLTGMCYDDTTVLPTGSAPPPPTCPAHD